MSAQIQQNSEVCDALRIPDEIWHEIILLACDSQDFPLVSYGVFAPPPESAPRQLKPVAKIMSNVCVRWNRLIVSASLLWVTTLVLIHDFDTSLSKKYSEWLRDSENSDIDVFILTSGPDCLEIVNEFFQLVLPFSARWRIFFVSGLSHYASHILNLLSEDLHMKRLSSVSLDLERYTPSIPFLFKPKTTVLCHLYLQSMILLLTPNPRFEFNALDTLKLVDCGFSLEALAAMLAQMPVLRSLRIDRMRNPLEPAREIVHLNNLSDVYLCGCLSNALRILRTIRSPSLRDLGMTCVAEPRTWDPSFVGPSDFWPSACLKHLTIAIDITALTGLISVLVCPKLEELSITIGEHQSTPLDEFRRSESRLTKGRVLSNLKTFELRSPNYSVFIFVLKHLELPALTSLRLLFFGYCPRPKLLKYAAMNSPINLPLLTHLTMSSLPIRHDEKALEYLSMPSLKHLRLLMQLYPYVNPVEWNVFSTRYRGILNRIEHLSIVLPYVWEGMHSLFLQLHMLKSLKLSFYFFKPELLRRFRFFSNEVRENFHLEVQGEKSVLPHTRESLIWLPPLSSLDVIINENSGFPYDQTQAVAALRYLVADRVRAGKSRMTLKVVPSPEDWPESDRAWMEARVELKGNF